MKRLRILHCIRTPIGGSFRHVCDLAEAQAAVGHQVGIVCAANMGGKSADAKLAALAPTCKLGIRRIDMSRNLGLRDLGALAAIRTLARETRPHVLHGHGAKGGAYVRAVARGVGAKAIYTPHGGSLHYSRNSLIGWIYLTAERLLARRTDGLLFESDYAARTYREKVGEPACALKVVHNGLQENEFRPVKPDDYAAEFLFVGELRTLKGVDVLIEALHNVNESRAARLVIVGEGPDEMAFRELVEETGLTAAARFAGAMPARLAFRLGPCLVVPSRAESLPYIVLEAVAAGRPMIATRVGGIPEIFGELDHLLVAPDEAGALAVAMSRMLSDPDHYERSARTLRRRARTRFRVEAMVEAITGFYRVCGGGGPPPKQPRKGARQRRVRAG